jgi:phage terminase large subunit GpA-like protein
LTGWSRTDALVLGHAVLWGSPDDDTTWAELDALLRTRWTHPHGGTLRIDAAVVDSGDRTDRVYAFCFPRMGRRVWAGKGVAGSRPPCEPSKSKVRGGRLFLVGVDTIKSTLLDRLARGRSLRFSATLEAAYYEQLASERKVVRYARGQPVRRFERKPGARAEALDCLVYAFAARHMLTIPLDMRAAELTSVSPLLPAPSEVPSPWVSAW